jgi:hypothetical protein
VHKIWESHSNGKAISMEKHSNVKMTLKWGSHSNEKTISMDPSDRKAILMLWHTVKSLLQQFQLMCDMLHGQFLISLPQIWMSLQYGYVYRKPHYATTSYFRHLVLVNYDFYTTWPQYNHNKQYTYHIAIQLYQRIPHKPVIW